MTLTRSSTNQEIIDAYILGANFYDIADLTNLEVEEVSSIIAQAEEQGLLAVAPAEQAFTPSDVPSDSTATETLSGQPVASEVVTPEVVSAPAPVVEAPVVDSTPAESPAPVVDAAPAADQAPVVSDVTTAPVEG